MKKQIHPLDDYVTKSRVDELAYEIVLLRRKGRHGEARDLQKQIHLLQKDIWGSLPWTSNYSK